MSGKPFSSPSSRILLSICLAIFAIVGWVSWASARRSALELSRQNKEWEELNGYLLSDVHTLKTRYDRIEKTSKSGRGPSDYVLRQKIAELRNENGLLRKKVDEIYAKYEKDIKEVLEAKSRGVDLGTVSLAGGSGSGVSGGATVPVSGGKVLSVDENDEFVVINMGKNSGLRVGAELLAKRGGSLIAKLRVIEVRPNLAACAIRYLSKESRIQPEDEVGPVGA